MHSASLLLIIIFSLLISLVYANELKDSDDGFHNGFRSRVDIKSEDNNNNDIVDAAVVLIKPSFKSIYLAQIQNLYGEFGITIAMTKTGLIKAWNVDGKQFISFNASLQLPPASDIKLVKAVSYGNNPGIYVLDKSSKMHIFYFSLAIDDKIMVGERHWKKQESYSIQDTSNQASAGDAADNKKTCPSTNEDCEKLSSMVGFSEVPGKDKQSEDDDRAIIVQFNKVEIQLEEIDFNSANVFDISGLDSMLIIGNNKGEVIFQDIKSDTMKRSIINFAKSVDDEIISINVHQASHEVYFSTKTGLVQSFTYSTFHPIKTTNVNRCYVPAGDLIHMVAGFDYLKKSFLYATTKKGFFIVLNTKKIENTKVNCKLAHKLRLSPNGGNFDLHMLRSFAIASNSQSGELVLMDVGGNELVRPKIVSKVFMSDVFADFSEIVPVAPRSVVIRPIYSASNKKSTQSVLIIGSWQEVNGHEIQFKGRIGDMTLKSAVNSTKLQQFLSHGVYELLAQFGPLVIVFVGVVLFMIKSKKMKSSQSHGFSGYSNMLRSRGLDRDVSLSKGRYDRNTGKRITRSTNVPMNQMLRRDMARQAPNSIHGMGFTGRTEENFPANME